MKPKKLPALRQLPFMTPWCGPKAPAQTGMRDVVSRIIGSYADQRILQAAGDDVSKSDLLQRHDYSSTRPAHELLPDAEGAVWVPLEPHLIEGPIVIRPDDIVQLQSEGTGQTRHAPMS